MRVPLIRALPAGLARGARVGGQGSVTWPRETSRRPDRRSTASYAPSSLACAPPQRSSSRFGRQGSESTWRCSSASRPESRKSWHGYGRRTSTLQTTMGAPPPPLAVRCPCSSNCGTGERWSFLCEFSRRRRSPALLRPAEPTDASLRAALTSARGRRGTPIAWAHGREPPTRGGPMSAQMNSERATYPLREDALHMQGAR
jgi:hypothetical protein